MKRKKGERPKQNATVVNVLVITIGVLCVMVLGLLFMDEKSLINETIRCYQWI